MTLLFIFTVLLIPYLLAGTQFTRNYYARELANFYVNKPMVIEAKKADLEFKRKEVEHVSYCNMQYKYLSEKGCDCDAKTKYNKLDREVKRLEEGEIDPPTLDKKMVLIYPWYIYEHYLKSKTDPQIVQGYVVGENFEPPTMALDDLKLEQAKYLLGKDDKPFELTAPVGYENHPIFNDPLSKQIHETWDALMKLAEKETKPAVKEKADPAVPIHDPETNEHLGDVVLNGAGEVIQIIDPVRIDVADPTLTATEFASKAGGSPKELEGLQASVLNDPNKVKEIRSRIKFLRDSGYDYTLQPNGNLIIKSEVFELVMKDYHDWKAKKQNRPAPLETERKGKPHREIDNFLISPNERRAVKKLSKMAAKRYPDKRRAS